jgi:hypothetical protein
LHNFVSGRFKPFEGTVMSIPTIVYVGTIDTLEKVALLVDTAVVVGLRGNIDF